MGKPRPPVMRRGVASAFLGLCGLLLAAATARAGEDCHSHPDLVGPCFRMRGRAALFNGNPTVRIWRVGTRRVLGVSARAGTEALPAALRAHLDWEHVVFADFVLCPFTRMRPGVMQFVCVAAVANLRRAPH